jgi:hypothetical protein
MDKHIERIVIGLAFVALAALVFMKLRPVAVIENIPAENISANEVSGPLYLLGNLPWAYQPWVGNVIPQYTSGQVGQNAGLTPTASNNSTLLNDYCNGGC